MALTAREQATTGEVADRLLTAAMDEVEKCSTGQEQPDRDAAILELHATGISLARIQAGLAMRGILTANGCPVSVNTINTTLKANGLKANGELKR